MEEVKRSISGAITYWTLTDTDISKLQTALTPLGQATLIPNRSGVLVMREAIAKAYSQKDYLIRHTKSRNKLEVVNEVKGDNNNSYHSTLVVDVDNLASCPQQLLDAYKERQQVLPASEVAMILTKIVKQLGGVTLRESGGFYWLPPESVSQFRQVAQGVRAAAVGTNKVYFITTELDDSTVVGIKDSLTDEVTTTADLIIDELSKGMMQHAIDNRRSKAKHLMEKVKKYEGLLSSSLEELRNSVEKIEVAAAAAELAAAQQKELVHA